MRLAPGTRLGPYEILAPIGSGGMGEVYRARDTRLGRDVALKILPEDLANDLSRRQRFEQEARAVAVLNHPNIVAVYDVGEGYMVSELVDGEPLRAAKFGLRKTLDIATQIASGLAAAHAAGIVHRDLKPDNVLLTRDGRAKILDFGLARMRQPQSSPDQTVTVRTEPGVVMGTVGYMSPERVRGLDADHRSDIFSFGIMLYEMLSGQRAFHGETSVDTMQAILRQDPPDLPRTVPGGVREVVTHCLEKDAANRFQSASDLGFALHALAQGDSQSGTALAPIAAAPQRGKLWMAALVLAVVGTFVLTRWLAREPLAPRWSAVQLGTPEIALNPRLSPDGRLLAFQAMIAESTQVAVMKPESDNWSVLTRRRDQGLIDFICWSSDGATIYFSRISDVPRGVFSVPFLGGEEHLVLENAGNPAALPDGTLLVMRINQRRRKQLQRFWPDTGKLQDLPVELAPVTSGFPLQLLASRDGRRAFVFGTIPGASGGKPSLIDVDLSAASARPIPMNALVDSEIAAVTLSADGKALIAAVRSKSLGRIVSIPLEGRGVPRDLFTVTGDVLRMDAGADGSILVNLWDSSGEVVSFPHGGGQPQKIAAFPHLASNMVVALADGRAVVGVQSSGRSRLMAVARGKDPAPLINTTEETSGPMTAVAGDRIAFVIGPAPRENIAIAGVSNGRISARIAPGKGVIGSLAAAPDGGTLYFTAAGSVWSIDSGGEPRRICAGDAVAAHPSGSMLVVARYESSQTRLFEVPAAVGTEREIPADRASPLSSLISPGAIRGDGQMLVSLNMIDSWFNPLALLDLRSGRIARLPGDGVSDLHSGAWTRDGQIVATRLGLNSRIWKFTPEGK
jgi:predicted Ser/Thr protein kinase